ncbi:MAG: glutamine--tRNA ligase/YqeY domain fusion protein [Lentimicrobiaceae bacterium]|nr:glutamine--tRNA ligase/YqeY domain fusion protein [Lentimicrobiaceae bacterium]
MTAINNASPKQGLNFIEAIIEEQLNETDGKLEIYTRFPPEPNGYLHIGHAKSICLNFGIAKKYRGKTNLRFDDTNPVKEDVEYVDSIKEDIQWLGFQWHSEHYASDYFEQLYQWAEQLIAAGKAYVDESSQEQISQWRGVPTAPGTESPYRNRPAAESLALFQRMRQGEFPDGHCVLRAKIDMASPNMHLRDPIMYRILHTHHHRTGGNWCIYPMYDYAHGQSDSIEGITHSICTLEFEVHRPLYDWFCEALQIHHPQQIEFARLNINYTVMSKRKLLQLVQEGYVSGWDDPRMPTICGLRRRGYTPLSLRNFAETVGVAKRENVIDLSLLEFCVREDLNKTAYRTMAVLNPVKLIIDNYPDGMTEEMDAVNNPEDLTAGTRKVPFSKELWIEQNDFMENPPKKYFRLSLGNEVRLKYAYIIKCVSVDKDKDGNITAVHCEYDPQTKSGMAESNRKVKGTIHWLSVNDCKQAEVRLYDRLFSVAEPDKTEEGKTFVDNLNPNSLEIVQAYTEKHFIDTKPLTHYQFERLGYFTIDKDSTPDRLVFNKTTGLKDSFKNCG